MRLALSRERLADNLPPPRCMAKKQPLPYWLAGGTETCEFCSFPHVVQVEYRCAGCDRAGCGQCVAVVRATGELLCRDCMDGEGEDAG